MSFSGEPTAKAVEAAKKACAPSRIGWERAEPVAESFGDIDPKVDVHEDGRDPATDRTGWHRLRNSSPRRTTRRRSPNSHSGQPR